MALSSQAALSEPAVHLPPFATHVPISVPHFPVFPIKTTDKTTNTNRNTNNYNKFPSPAMLESYEEICPGFTKELMELTKIEQEQKGQNHKNWMKSMNTTLRFGQFLSFIFSVIIFQFVQIFNST